MFFWRKRGNMKIVQSFGRGAKQAALRLTLCDLNPDMTDAWLDRFFGVDSVEITQGDLLETGAEAVLAPANSFGDMSGGVDKRIDDFFRGAAQEALTRQIREKFYGELPVGTALVIPMQNSRVPYLVAAPTMRVPEDVADTLNAYLAFRAALVAILQHNAGSSQPIRWLAAPGLATGVGRMPCAVAALQMRTAHDNILGGEWEKAIHPALAPFAFGKKNIAWREPKGN